MKSKNKKILFLMVFIFLQSQIYSVTSYVDDYVGIEEDDIIRYEIVLEDDTSYYSGTLTITITDIEQISSYYYITEFGYSDYGYKINMDFDYEGFDGDFDIDDGEYYLIVYEDESIYDTNEFKISGYYIINMNGYDSYYYDNGTYSVSLTYNSDGVLTYAAYSDYGGVNNNEFITIEKVYYNPNADRFPLGGMVAIAVVAIILSVFIINKVIKKNNDKRVHASNSSSNIYVNNTSSYPNRQPNYNQQNYNRPNNNHQNYIQPQNSPPVYNQAPPTTQDFTYKQNQQESSKPDGNKLEFCPFCGTKLDKHSKVCEVCGSNLGR